MSHWAASDSTISLRSPPAQRAGCSASKRPIWHATQRNSTSTQSYPETIISMQSGSLYAFDQCGAKTLFLHARKFMLERHSSRTWRYRNLPYMAIVQRHVDHLGPLLRGRVPNISFGTCAINALRAEVGAHLAVALVKEPTCRLRR